MTFCFSEKSFYDLKIERLGKVQEALTLEERREQGRIVPDLGVMGRVDLSDLGGIHLTAAVAYGEQNAGFLVELAQAAAEES